MKRVHLSKDVIQVVLGHVTSLRTFARLAQVNRAFRDVIWGLQPYWWEQYVKRHGICAIACKQLLVSQQYHVYPIYLTCCLRQYGLQKGCVVDVLVLSDFCNISDVSQALEVVTEWSVPRLWLTPGIAMQILIHYSGVARKYLNKHAQLFYYLCALHREQLGDRTSHWQNAYKSVTYHPCVRFAQSVPLYLNSFGASELDVCHVIESALLHGTRIHPQFLIHCRDCGMLQDTKRIFLIMYRLPRNASDVLHDLETYLGEQVTHVLFEHLVQFSCKGDDMSTSLIEAFATRACISKALWMQYLEALAGCKNFSIFLDVVQTCDKITLANARKVLRGKTSALHTLLNVLKM